MHSDTSNNAGRMPRRAFLRQTSAWTGGLLWGTQAIETGAVRADAESPLSELPRRVLGRTKASVTTMCLGTAPCGFSPQIPPPKIAEIVNYALDLGINMIDAAPAYVQAEEGVGLALGPRRKDVFLATKVLADDVKDAERSLSESFRLLKTDYIDLVYYHSAGDRDIKKGLGPDGVFTWLVKQRKAGKFRFLGISGHNRPGKFIPLIETGEVDVLMTVVNFVDRHTYGFEKTVLPVARKHNVGIVAMKVFGGASRKAGSYKNPKAPPEMPLQHLELAVRYALTTPGVAVLNLGVHNKEQVRKNVELVKQFRPLSTDEYAAAIALGEPLARKWGEHFGPVA